MMRSQPSRVGGPLPVLLALLSLAGIWDTARSKNEEGNRLYREQKYVEALKRYTEAQLDAPDSPQLHYNLGNVLFRQGELEKAGDEYQRAMAAANPELDPDAVYNLGNAFYGQDRLQDALAAYQRTLKMAPDDLDAKRNLELTLQRMQEQPPPPQPQPQEDPSEDGEESPNDSPPQEGEGGEPEEDPAGGEGKEKKEESEKSSQEPGEPKRLSREEAERILSALAEDEKENLKRKLKAQREKPRRVERDW